jgi:hypothetical protein
LSNQPAKAVKKETNWRVYAASFYESVTLQQAAAKCIDRDRTLAALDLKINAFNELLATKWGG